MHLAICNAGRDTHPSSRARNAGKKLNDHDAQLEKKKLKYATLDFRENAIDRFYLAITASVDERSPISRGWTRPSPISRAWTTPSPAFVAWLDALPSPGVRSFDDMITTKIGGIDIDNLTTNV